MFRILKHEQLFYFAGSKINYCFLVMRPKMVGDFSLHHSIFPAIAGFNIRY